MKFKENIENIPPYVPGIKVKGKLKLSSNENPLGTSPMAIDAIQKINNYSVYPEGTSKELREAIAQKNGVDIDNIIVGNGSDEVLMWPSLCLIKEGYNAVTGANTFSEYTFSTLVTGGEIRKAPLIDGTFNKESILNLVDDKTKIVYICNPNNPTGTFLPKDELLEIINSISKEILIVIDEAYGEYGDQEYFSCIGEINKYKNLIVLKTFSKIYGMASLRLGYAIGSTEIIQTLYKTKQPFNVNQAAQTGGLAAISDIEFVNKSLKMNKEGKEFLYKELNRLGLKYYKTQANFVCINVNRDSKEVYDSIMEQGITIRSCTSFGLKNYIRVTIGSLSQMKDFIQYLEKAINV